MLKFIRIEHVSNKKNGISFHFKGSVRENETSLSIFSLQTQQIEVRLVAIKSAFFIVLSLYPLSFFTNTPFKYLIYYVKKHVFKYVNSPFNYQMSDLVMVGCVKGCHKNVPQGSEVEGGYLGPGQLGFSEELVLHPST